MTGNHIVLVKAQSVGNAMPDRWWIPSSELLDRIAPHRAAVKLLAVEPDTEGRSNLWDASSIWLLVEERSGETLKGEIVFSRLERDGYRVGDVLSVTLDRVFDVELLDDDGRPIFNEDRARFTIGKRVLVGLTVISPEGGLMEQRQFVGTVAAVDPRRGIQLELGNRASYWLPPDARALTEARPGEYRLRSTSETVVDPDYTCSWTVTKGEGYDPPPSSGFKTPVV